MQQARHRSLKSRVDKLLVDNGYFESRSQARSAILSGNIRVGSDCVIQKASELWESTTIFNVVAPLKYVSRGALKLKPALDEFLPRTDGLTGLDIGASTGGFTDLLLQRGASKVYAVDVGYGQLHYKLRQNSRIVCLENFNARYLSSEQVPDKIDVLAVDVSFISLKKILPPTKELLKQKSWAFVLIKPQFEAKPFEVHKGGVVKSSEIHNRIVCSIVTFAKEELDWNFVQALPTKPKSVNANTEFLAVFRIGVS